MSDTQEPSASVEEQVVECVKRLLGRGMKRVTPIDVLEDLQPGHLGRTFTQSQDPAYVAVFNMMVRAGNFGELTILGDKAAGTIYAVASEDEA